MIAAAIYGKYWSGWLVHFSVDIAAVVHVLQATYSRESHLMHLIRVWYSLLLISTFGSLHPISLEIVTF